MTNPINKAIIAPIDQDLKHIGKHEPTNEQMLVKVRFWQAVNENPTLNSAEVGLAEVKRMCSGQMEVWLRIPGFRAWFFSENHAEQMLAAAGEMAVTTLCDIMRNKDPKMSNARVRAAEKILDRLDLRAARMSPEDAVSHMTEEQLRQLVASKAPDLVSKDKK